jgi:multidrug resistance protein, MATE family
VISGLASCLETFCGQAYGSGDRDKTRAYLARGLCITLAFAVPISIVWLFAGPILIALGQDPILSHMVSAETVTRFLVPVIVRYSTH